MPSRISTYIFQSVISIDCEDEPSIEQRAPWNGHVDPLGGQERARIGRKAVDDDILHAGTFRSTDESSVARCGVDASRYLRSSLLGELPDIAVPGRKSSRSQDRSSLRDEDDGKDHGACRPTMRRMMRAGSLRASDARGTHETLCVRHDFNVAPDTFAERSASTPDPSVSAPSRLPDHHQHPLRLDQHSLGHEHLRDRPGFRRPQARSPSSSPRSPRGPGPPPPHRQVRRAP